MESTSYFVKKGAAPSLRFGPHTHKDEDSFTSEISLSHSLPSKRKENKKVSSKFKKKKLSQEENQLSSLIIPLYV